MATVNCKKCSKEVDLDHAYHARVRGFLCDSCNSDSTRNSLLLLLSVLFLFGLFAAGRSCSSVSEKDHLGEGYSIGEVYHGEQKVTRTTHLIRGGIIPEGKTLSRSWYELHSGNVSKIFRFRPDGFGIEDTGMRNWKGLILEDEPDRKVILIDHPVEGLVTVTIEEVVEQVAASDR